jgi:cystathionine gamma-synthase
VKVSGLGHFPLGTPVPQKEHAVCVSLPTFDDIVGYEEKKPEILKKLHSGYPRFVRHRKVQELAEFWNQTHSLNGKDLFFFSNAKDWDFAQKTAGLSDPRIEEVEDYLIVGLPPDSKESARLSKFLQHTGCGLSSRHAEKILEALGQTVLTESITPNVDAEKEIKKIISEAHGPNIEDEDVMITASGANAFTAVFRSALELSRNKGKQIWIRIGWLYLDTIEVMNLLCEPQERIIDLLTPKEFETIETVFEQYGSQIAGVVTEFPSNPLLHSCNLEKVRELTNRHGALLIVDPTMASPKNAKVSGFGDVVINSLTKYANWEGDVMMGSAVFPKESPLGLEIKETAFENSTKPFYRDLERMAEQIPFYNNFIDQTNQSQAEIVTFLKSHPKIKNVFWAYQDSTGSNYSSIAGENKPGCIVSFEINGSFKDFYDNLELLKSPSFGTEFSLCCPYVYLAHYNLINDKTGKEKLRHAGLSPELLRLSVGLESPDEIKEKIALALKEC